MKGGKSSVLYAVPLIGAGTLLSESLCSYFYRLAYLHRVAPSALYRAYIAPRLRALGMGTHVCYQIQDGMGLSADSVVLRCLTDALAELTGVEAIRHGSLQGLAALVGHTGLAHLKRRYCPMCFVEHRHGWYGQVLWEFQAVKACPLHEVRLVPEVCGDASVRLAPGKRPQLFGVCRQCGSIGMTCDARPPISADSTEVWVAQEVGDVIAFVSGGGVLSREGLDAGVADCIGQYRSRTALAQRLRCVPSALLVGSRGRPSLSVLLAMAALRGCSLLSIFRGGPMPTRIGLQRFALPVRAEASWRSDAQLEHKIASLVEKYGSLDACSDSGAVVAQRLGVHRTFLKRRAPELWRQIVSARKKYVAEQLKCSRESNKARLLAAIEDVIMTGKPFTQSSILREAQMNECRTYQMIKVLKSILCILDRPL